MELLIRFDELLNAIRLKREEHPDLLILEQHMSEQIFRLFRFINTDAPYLSGKNLRVRMCEFERELTVVENIYSKRTS